MTHAQRILKIIEDNPDIASFDIRKLYYPDHGHDRCVIAHALTKLFRLGLVERRQVIERNSKTYRYTKTGKDMNTGNNMNLEGRILGVIQQNPGATSSMIRDAFERAGWKPSSVSSALPGMFRNGKVTRSIVPGSEVNGVPKFQYYLPEATAAENQKTPRSLNPEQAAEFVGCSLSALYGYHALKWFGNTRDADGKRIYLVDDLERLKKHIAEKVIKLSPKPSEKAARALEQAQEIRSHFAALDGEQEKKDPFKLAIKIASLIVQHEATLACTPEAFASLSVCASRISKLA